MTFLESLPPYGDARNDAVRAAILAGRLDTPAFVTVVLGRVELRVSRDYLTIEDGRVPMTCGNAQLAVESLGALLPTPRIVEAIEVAAKAAGGLISFDAWPRYQDDSQLFTSTILWREANIAGHLKGKPAPALLAGHLKDVVLSSYMPTGRVVIFGARDFYKQRIQPVYPIPGGAPGHGDFFDQGYAGGTRAVLNACLLDGHPALVSDILTGPLASLLGGPVARLRYPTPSTPATDRPSAPAGRPTDPAPAPRLVLRVGDSGPRVLELQRLLTAVGIRTDEDGIFGQKTRTNVAIFQRREGLDADGLAGDKTMGALRRYQEQGDTLPDADDPAPLPLGDDERAREFGSFQWVSAPTATEPGAIRILGNWVRKNIVTITIPQLIGIKGCLSGRVTCHRLAAPTFLRFFAAVEEASLMHLILTWDGCWNPRKVRGGESLSNHATGCDFDINAQWNARGTKGAAQGERGSLVEIDPIAVASGLGCGRGWPTPDAMHYGARKAG